MKRLLWLLAAGYLLLSPALCPAADDTQTLPPSHPAVETPKGEETKEAAPAEAQEAPKPLSGRVVETMNAGGYSYILLETKGGEKVWVAVAETSVKVGSDMSVKPGPVMEGFQSKTLKRTFDKIIFSDGVIAQKGENGEGTSGKKSPGSKGAVVTPGEKIAVEKAKGDNAYTVAEIYKLRSSLNKKNVLVRGKVVKVSTGIMDRNWIHLQDGSGVKKKGTNNLVVTSQAHPAVGDVVTMGGTIIKDKDFGSGYKYDVILEKGEIVEQ